MTARIGGGAKLGDKITTLVSQLPNLVDQVTIVLAFDDDSGDRTNCLTFIGQLHLLSSEGETINNLAYFVGADSALLA